MKKILAIISTFFLLNSVALAEKLPNPLAGGASKFTTPEDIVSRLVKMILGFTGTVAIIVIIYGAVLISTSAGNDKKIGQGKDAIIWAIIGIVVTFSAYAIVSATLKVITF